MTRFTLKTLVAASALAASGAALADITIGVIGTIVIAFRL